MEYFKVLFNSHSTFDQMIEKENDNQVVEMFCQELDEEDGGKEIIICLPTPEDYNYDQAQFSISKSEAELMIFIFRFHFNI